MTKMKANKKKNDDSNNKHSWPNFPQQLISLFPRQKKLMQNITSFGGVTKTWRSPLKQCSPDGKPRWPQLVEIDTKPCSNHIFDIKFDEEYPWPYYKRSSYKHHVEEGYFKGSSNGFLFSFSTTNLSGCYLRWPCGAFSYLPLLGHNNPPLKFVAVLPCLDRMKRNPSVMVLTGQSSHTFAFLEWAGNDWKWDFRDYKVKDPYNPGQNMEFCHGVGFKGKFYMLSLQGGLAVIEDTGSDFEVTGVSKCRAVPCNRSRQYREFLVELNGEMLLVFLVSRKSINVVDDVEVFRLDVEELLWLKVESLGDGAMFLEEECCMGVYAEKIGCRKNCIYFTHSRVENDLWFVYDMGIRQISPASGGKSDYMKWNEPIDLEDPPKPRGNYYPGKW